MPISLVDYASLIKDEMSVGLFQNLYRMKNILPLFPVVEAKSFVVRGSKWTSLPTSAFRKLNADFSQSTGKTEPQEDIVAILGSTFNADKALDKNKAELLRDPTDLQFDMHNRALERVATDYIFNGDVDTDPDAFNGLLSRFADGVFAAAQDISCSGSTDAYKVHADAAHSAVFFDKLDEAIYAADLFGVDGQGAPRGAIFGNKASFLGIQKAAKLCGYSIQTVDVLEKKWLTYKGLPLVDVGLKRDKSTEIITNTYDPGDGDNDSSYLYIVRFAEPDGNVESAGSSGLFLAQAGNYEWLGPESYNVYEKWTVQWILGLSNIGDDYCAARLKAFKMAAS